MITNLQFKEVKIISGGRFLPGLTRRLNNVIGKPLEKVAREGKRILDQVSEVSGADNVRYKVELNNGKLEVSAEATY